MVSRFRILDQCRGRRQRAGAARAPDVSAQLAVHRAREARARLRERYAEMGSIPWTWDRANPHVAATMEPSARIDYVLVGPPRDGRGRVSSVERLGHRPVGGVWPSDHAALLVELGVERLL